MLVDREYGDANQAQTWRQQLLSRQNPDGGWPLLKRESSHPLVTGQSLYALNIAGQGADTPAIRNARKYLVATQEKDGSWKALSRNKAGGSNVVAVYLGTA